MDGVRESMLAAILTPAVIRELLASHAPVVPTHINGQQKRWDEATGGKNRRPAAKSSDLTYVSDVVRLSEQCRSHTSLQHRQTNRQ